VLPWISSALFFSDQVHFISHLTLDLSPTVTQLSAEFFAEDTMDIYGADPSYRWPLFPVDLFFHFVMDDYHHSLVVAPLVMGAYGFAAGFVMVALLVTGLWRSGARSVFLAALGVLVCGTVLSLAAQIWFCATVAESWATISEGQAAWFGNEVYRTDRMIPNAGLFLAILGMVSLTLAYLAPVRVRLPLRLDAGPARKLREYWLMVPDGEQVPAIFLTTLLASASLYLATRLL
jgi:hypothetical protein